MSSGNNAHKRTSSQAGGAGGGSSNATINTASISTASQGAGTGDVSITGGAGGSPIAERETKRPATEGSIQQQVKEALSSGYESLKEKVEEAKEKLSEKKGSEKQGGEKQSSGSGILEQAKSQVRDLGGKIQETVAAYTDTHTGKAMDTSEDNATESRRREKSDGSLPSERVDDEFPHDPHDANERGFETNAEKEISSGSAGDSSSSRESSKDVGGVATRKSARKKAGGGYAETKGAEATKATQEQATAPLPSDKTGAINSAATRNVPFVS